MERYCLRDWKTNKEHTAAARAQGARQLQQHALAGRLPAPLHATMPPGPEGTGPLEADEQLLAGAGDALPRNQKHALLYRMGQKVRPAS